MTTTTDMESLLASIDAGDDTALPAVADAMEEAGDPLPGLRQLQLLPSLEGGIRCRHRPLPFRGKWRWYAHREAAPPCKDSNADAFAAVAGQGGPLQFRPTECAVLCGCKYPTRSAAFLALAAALTEGEARASGWKPE